MTLRNCYLCKKSIGKRMRLHCGTCKGLFHLECGNVTEMEARIMREDNSPWHCTDCTRSVARRSSTHFSLLNTSSPKLHNDNELKSLIRELQSEVKEMRKSMDFLNEKYEEELKRSKVLSEMVSEVSKDNQELKREVQKLKAVLNVNESAKIRNNICVTGLLSSLRTENKEASLMKLFQSLCPEVKESDVDNIHHISVKNGVKSIITMKSVDLKQRLLRSRVSKGKITARDSGIGDSAAPIYIEEELTKESYLLFKKAKQQLKDNYKYIWHRNGNILVRKADGERYIVIRSVIDLDEISV